MSDTRPLMSHSACDHASTKKDRAKCRTALRATEAPKGSKEPNAYVHLAKTHTAARNTVTEPATTK